MCAIPPPVFPELRAPPAARADRPLLHPSVRVVTPRHPSGPTATATSDPGNINNTDAQTDRPRSTRSAAQDSVRIRPLLPRSPGCNLALPVQQAAKAAAAPQASLFDHPVPLPSGRFSSVFLAIHRPTGTPVVVKTYLKRDLLRRAAASPCNVDAPGAASGALALARRVRVERAALARLRAPRLLAATHDHCTVALVMTRIPGVPLAKLFLPHHFHHLQEQPHLERLVDANSEADPPILSNLLQKQQRPLAPANSIRSTNGEQASSAFKMPTASLATHALVCALQRVHDANIVHLDLTLENVIVNPDELLSSHDDVVARSATIVDFGAAELADDPEPDRDYTESATVDILAPELVDGNMPPTRASDVWALGVCVFRMLTGKLSPFRTEGGPGASDYAVLQRISAHAADRSLPFDDQNSKCPIEHHARDFVIRCLHPDPAKRLGVAVQECSQTNGEGTASTAMLTVDYDEIRKHSFIAQSMTCAPKPVGLASVSEHEPKIAIVNSGH